MAVKITCPTCGYSITSRTQALAEYGQRRHSCDKHLKAAARRARTVRNYQARGITRPCTHPTHHAHGTNARAALDRCRCQPCRDAAYKATKKWRARVDREGHVYIDARPALAHVRDLQAAGLGWKRIATLAGVANTSVYALIWGRPDRNAGKPSTKARRETVNKILAVPLPSLDELGSRIPVPSIGTVRRIQALATLGWSIDRLATEAGLADRQALDRALRADVTSAGTARTIRDTYERLWNTPPTAGDRFEQAAITRTRNHATRQGWAPPLAWDDDQLDQPDATPALGAPTDDHVDELAVHAVVHDRRPLRLTGPDRVEAIRRLAALGHSDRAIARLVGCVPETVLRTRKTHGIPSTWIQGEEPAA